VVEKNKTYYIEAIPQGNVAETNKILAANLAGEDALEDVLCRDGVRRNLWRCSDINATMLWNSRHNWEEVGFRIRIWQQEGKGQIRIASGHNKNPRFPYGRPCKSKRKTRKKGSYDRQFRFT